MKKTSSVTGLACALALVAAAPSAMAANGRTWISGKGVDQAGCGPIASPCRTMQYAHDNTNAGGEIDVLDSAGYGSVTITKSLSIVGDGVIAGLLATAGTDAVTISAGANDTVVLRGLTIEGAGVGRTGILMTSGGMLDVANCVVQNFGGQGGTGIAVVNNGSASSNVQIVNTTSSNNNSMGVSLQGEGAASRMKIVMDHVVASKNGLFGISVLVLPGAAITVAASVSDSLLSLNGSSGLRMTGNATVNVDRSRAEGNVLDGFGISSWNNAVNPSGLLVIGRSVSSTNGRAGFANDGGTIQSFTDNRIVGNGLPTVGAIGTIAAQ